VLEEGAVAPTKEEWKSARYRAILGSESRAGSTDMNMGWKMGPCVFSTHNEKLEGRLQDMDEHTQCRDDLPHLVQLGGAYIRAVGEAKVDEVPFSQ